MDSQPRLIYVDDEAGLRDMVADYMQRENWSVRTAACGKSLDILLASEDADLIVLDINMPGEDGLSVLRRIRDTSTMPVVMLTAASNIADKIAGLDMGADDYMTKPFDLRELKTRIKAVLRRRPPVSAAAPADDRETQTIKHILPFGKLFVDLNARNLIHADGMSEPVTAMEFDLLQVFLQNPDRVLTRDRLLDLAHNRDNDPFDRSIDVRIARIRKKIEHNPAKPQALKTVRGVGYIFTPPKRTK
ncbi:response regulator [Rhizobium laguerreae]|uniref:response regulator n=1 Tax=Rhizobium laguerreae TaxID=1076926 RepID=UPI001C914CC8|nr:response regulator [Rhizobium laguerreae]MBY3384007.1 response regulator [Rhizobium laguerreae]